MPSINEVCQHLDSLAPLRLAEEWDNVGLLVGDPESAANRIMTCLTVTPETVAEAIDNQADLIVSHHPLPFRPVKRITTDQVPTRMLWQLIRAGIAVYSPHTGFDSAANGINQSLGEQLGLTDLRPLNPLENDPQGLGSGRIGNLPARISVAEFGQHLKAIFELSPVATGRPRRPIDHQDRDCLR
jgi:dinuclear metal center YbgI/SA1388 family protein